VEQLRLRASTVPSRCRGQIWLDEVFHDAFRSGRLRREADLPRPLTAYDFARSSDDPPEVKLFLEELFLAAHLLGDRRVAEMVRYLELGPQGSRLRMCTEKRNSSLLGRGLESVSTKGLRRHERSWVRTYKR
jgi:hypothetical protein